MCLYSLPWLAVVAIADGSFALGMLLLTLLMEGRNWHWSGKVWFVPLAVFCGILYTASFPLILKGWNQATGQLLRIGNLLRSVPQILLYFYIIYGLYTVMFGVCLDRCSSLGLGLRVLIFLAIVCLCFGTLWPNYVVQARVVELATGIRPTWTELLRGRVTRREPEAQPAPSAHSSANASPKAAVSPSKDVERGDN